MRRALAIGAAVALAGTAAQAGATAPLPSGAAPPMLYEVVTAPGYDAPIWHFRFLWQGLTPDMLAGDTMSADMLALCARIAAPRIAAEGGQAERIVISVSDRKTAFGEATPEAVQSFDAFVLDDAGTCQWEPF